MDRAARFFYNPTHNCHFWFHGDILMFITGCSFKRAGIASPVSSHTDNNRLEKWLIVYSATHRKRGRVPVLFFKDEWLPQIEESLSGSKAAVAVRRFSKGTANCTAMGCYFSLFQELCIEYLSNCDFGRAGLFTSLSIPFRFLPTNKFYSSDKLLLKACPSYSVLTTYIWTQSHSCHPFLKLWLTPPSPHRPCSIIPHSLCGYEIMA